MDYPAHILFFESVSLSPTPQNMEGFNIEVVSDSEELTHLALTAPDGFMVLVPAADGLYYYDSRSFTTIMAREFTHSTAIQQIGSGEVAFSIIHKRDKLIRCMRIVLSTADSATLCFLSIAPPHLFSKHPFPIFHKDLSSLPSLSISSDPVLDYFPDIVDQMAICVK